MVIFRAPDHARNFGPHFRFAERRRMKNTIARPTRFMAVLLLASLFLAACGSSKPAKYRKKRECDCPKWNQVPNADPSGVHAMVDTGASTTRS